MLAEVGIALAYGMFVALVWLVCDIAWPPGLGAHAVVAAGMCSATGWFIGRRW